MLGRLSLEADPGRLKTAYSTTGGPDVSIRYRIEQIPEGARVPIVCPHSGGAQVASCAHTTGCGHRGLQPITVRLVVRRTRLTREQATLWPDCRYHAPWAGQTFSLVSVLSAEPF